MLRGTPQHQRAGKGFNSHLRSLLHSQSSLHCLDTKGNEALTGFPETANNLMTPFTYKNRILWKADKREASFWPIYNVWLLHKHYIYPFLERTHWAL